MRTRIEPEPEPESSNFNSSSAKNDPSSSGDVFRTDDDARLVGRGVALIADDVEEDGERDEIFEEKTVGGSIGEFLPRQE